MVKKSASILKIMALGTVVSLFSVSPVLAVPPSSQGTGQLAPEDQPCPIRNDRRSAPDSGLGSDTQKEAETPVKTKSQRGD